MCDLNVPSEVTIFDLFVHESMALAIPPVVTFSSLMEPRDPGLHRSRLPLHEPLIELGAPSPAPLPLEVPRYEEMIAPAMSRMGWAPEEFAGFRLRTNDPPLPAVLTMRYGLPVTA